MTVAVLFPGQGAQRRGMMRDVPDTPTARAALAEARQTLAELGVSGDLDDPGHDTVLTQLALVATGVASARALLDDSGVVAAFAAGHSVGAFAAAVTAGVLTLSEALVAVHVRAETMRDVCAGRRWGMAAITGAPTRTVRTLVDEVTTTTEPLWVANINSGTQTVVGGTAGALDAAERAARVIGARSFERLDVEIASHGPVQQPTAHALAAHLRTLNARPPALRYVTNTTGRAVNSAAAVFDDLAESVMRPVRWYDGVRIMGELGVTATVEATPGHTLTRLVAATVPGVTALSLEDDGLSRAVARSLRSG